MMRISLLFLIGISFILSGCNQDHPATIKGKLTNIRDSTITIEISADPITRIKPTTYTDVIAIEKDGKFSIPINIAYPGIVTLVSNDYQFIAHVILLQGGEVLLTANCDSLNETLEYHGINSGLNAFNLQETRFYSLAYRELREYSNDYILFKNGLDSLQSKSLKMLEDFSRTEKLSKKELLWLSSKINYRKYSTLHRRAYLMNAQPGDSDLQFFKTLNLEDHDAIQLSPTYVNAILDFILHEVHARGVFHSSSMDNTEYFETRYQVINEKLTGKVRDVILTIFISDQLKQYEAKAAEYYEKYLHDCKSPEMIEKTPDLLADYLEVTKQSLSEKVVLIPTDQKSPMEVLSQFEDKVLLLDFWASWCAPCIKGLPHTKELAEHYKNSDVLVVYIGNADQKSNLLNAIKKHQMDGMHIILNEEETEIWRQEFSIRGIPTYILIDKVGRVVNMDKPHQLTENSYTTIDGLLTQKQFE